MQRIIIADLVIFKVDPHLPDNFFQSYNALLPSWDLLNEFVPFWKPFANSCVDTWVRFRLSIHKRFLLQMNVLKLENQPWSIIVYQVLPGLGNQSTIGKALDIQKTWNMVDYVVKSWILNYFLHGTKSSCLNVLFWKDVF